MVELNLLPPQDRKRGEPNVWKYAAFVLPPVTVLALLVPEALVGRQLGQLRAEQDRLNGDIAALAPTKGEYDRLTATQRTLEEVTAVSGKLREGKTYWTNDVAAFSAQLPAGGGVALTSMNVKALDAGALASLQQGGVYLGKNVVREIDLSGTARSQQAVVNFLNVYENDPGFAVNFRSLGQEGETGRYTFAASVGLVGQGAAAPEEGAAAAGTPTPASAGETGGENVR
ncbi:fimbrial assembly protein [Deinococcus planocerae]|uniref:fimbrial assembly protein n=1 Tax=Deinococcus planocerae TaxID=1737569 RepID=UPI000C7F063F|nr:fimbrial assembly protein [Deinococcus planocerae]